MKTLLNGPSEALHLLRLRAFGAAQAERVANHNFRYFVFLDDLLQPLEVHALVLPADGLQPLRGNAQRIRNSNADSF